MAAFTAIAAGVGLAATAATTTGSFIQAGKQRRLQRQAEADAAKAMEAARKKLEINVFEGLAIQKEPYELERQALLSAGAQAIEAGRESERGAAATAGRIQASQQEAQAGVRTAMGKELMDLEKLTAEEESRLRDLQANLDLNEVQGAQMAAAQAAEASQKATAEGIQGVGNFIGQAASLAPLYARKTGQSQKALGQTQLTQDELARIGEVPNVTVGDQSMPMVQGQVSNIDLSLIPKMSRSQYKNWIDSLSAKQKAVLFGRGYGEAYDNMYGFNPIR